MKKTILAAIMAIGIAANAAAQDSNWTLNTRAYTTNYFTSLIYNVVAASVKHFAFHSTETDSMAAERIIPMADPVFPIGMSKKGFDDPLSIYGPYHRAFGNPIKHIGDYAVGLDVSYKSSFLGLYCGAYFKSQEVVYKATNANIRGFYVQPRAGLVLGGKRNALEAGVFYDAVTGCGGTVPETDKDMLKGGFGLDFALSSNHRAGKSKTIIQFSMPLHNFFNTDYAGQQRLKRKVGYITLSRRIIL